MTTKTLSRNRERVHVDERSGLDTISKGSLAVMGGISALIGIWAVACMVGAMISGGGPINLMKGWISAITGM